MTPLSPAAALASATDRLLTTLDRLDDTAARAPSFLPGWSRGHVVAHLVLNAEALAGALEAVARGESVTMYASDQVRDADIESLAPEPVTRLAGRLDAGSRRLTAAVAALPPALEDTVVPRTPGSQVRFRAGDVARMRLREVEIHHADMGLTYSPADWPLETVAHFIDEEQRRHDGLLSFTVRADDLGRSWRFGERRGPEIVGPGSALAWWLSGRDWMPV